MKKEISNLAKYKTKCCDSILDMTDVTDDDKGLQVKVLFILIVGSCVVFWNHETEFGPF